MANVKRFQDLVAWQKGMSLCTEVHRLTKSWPAEEKFGLVAQARRAAVSVPASIAEGFGRQATADLLRFLRIARGSLFEVHTHALIAVELGYLGEVDLPRDMLAETDRVLQALIRSLEGPREP